ncbi:MAG: glutamate racemase [Actinomycetota bacterium]
MDSRAIGVFDSGVGGLTIVRGLLELMPNEQVLYFGDTARYPYGPRSREEVRGFAMEISSWLIDQNVKLLVAACNSASSAGLDHVTAAFPGIPLIEVVLPAVRAAVKATRNRRIGVIGTELTITSGAYNNALSKTKANVEMFSQACPRFVEFVERGETMTPEVFEVAREYCAPLIAQDVDTLILGCTHYPLLSGVLSVVMPDAVLISSAEETAEDVFAMLSKNDMFRLDDSPPAHRFVSSGDAATFHALGQRFLGPEITGVEERRNIHA